MTIRTDEQRYESTNRGFVATEIFFVIALAVVIFAAVLYGFTQAKVYSRDNRRISDLKQITHALALYTGDEGKLPSGCEWSTEACWREFLMPHIIPTPEDPVNRGGEDCATEAGCLVYRYCPLEGGRFILSTNLEKQKKRSAENNPLCSLGGPNHYWVTN